jgi:hypothetical protein
MEKTALMLVLVTFLSLSLVVSSLYARSAMGKRGFNIFDSKDLIGAPVKDSRGQLLGIINEVMVDSRGHAFAVVNHGDDDLYGEGGVNTPVPFEALRIYRTKSGAESAVFTMDAEHLDFAPFLDSTKIGNRQYEADIYGDYGIQPYWTESSSCSK